MSVEGDWGKLEKLLQELASLGSPSTMVRAAFGVQQALVTEVRLGFRDQKSPYGKPWAPLKQRRSRNKDNGKILRDTGRLANSITGGYSGSEVRVGTNVEYAPYHQFGTNGRKVEERRYQPANAKGRFISKEKASKVKRGKVSAKDLVFKAGSGVIPPREFLPTRELPSAYLVEISDVIVFVLQKTAPSLIAAAG